MSIHYLYWIQFLLHLSIFSKKDWVPVFHHLLELYELKIIVAKSVKQMRIADMKWCSNTAWIFNTLRLNLAWTGMSCCFIFPQRYLVGQFLDLAILLGIWSRIVFSTYRIYSSKVKGIGQHIKISAWRLSSSEVLLALIISCSIGVIFWHAIADLWLDKRFIYA